VCQHEDVPPEPSALVGLVALAWLYGLGVRTLWTRAGRGHVVSTRQVGVFGVAILILLLALESPLDALSADLFAAHMVQHLLLILVAGPLLVLGAPLAPLLWSFPEPARRAIGRVLRRLSFSTRPGVAFVLHSLALWTWHAPALYEAALRSRGVHVVEHLSFLLTAILFWWAIRHARGASLLYLFGLAVESTVLGALLTFADAPWYAAHAATTAQWGLSPLADQQIAGLIMWVPGGVVYLGTGLALLAAWLKQSSWTDDTPDREARTPVRR
jgi:putative membrane protein